MRTFVLLCSFILPSHTGAIADDYNPSRSEGKVTVETTKFSYGPDNRQVPLRIYMPEQSNAPVVLFSHGLGGSNQGNKYLGNHWAGRGYVAVFMQHAGSDANVVKDARPLQKLSLLKKAANGENAQARFQDVKATIDQLEKLNQEGSFAGKFDLEKIGMSGHSFGAVTTQAVSGQNFGPRGQMFTDRRIRAAIAFSPSPPTYGYNSSTFAKVNVPWLLMTGTKDNSPIGSRTDPASRRVVFKDLPSSGRFYELVLEGAQHSAFSERSGWRDGAKNPNHHKAILAISSAFWDTYLSSDKSAEAWLRGDGPRSVLEQADVWQKK